MNISRLSAALMTSFGLLLALSAASPECSAQDSDVYFISDVVPPIDGDFNSAANWANGLAPSLVITPPATVPNVYGIDYGLSATFSGGTTTVRGLGVGSTSKYHLLGENYFGRLTMTGGTLQVIGDASKGLFSVGRENVYFYPRGGDYNKDTVVDGADYVIWRKTLGLPGSANGFGADGDGSGTIDQPDYDIWRASFGNVQQGGEIIMTGTSTVRANGLIIGERTPGLLSVGPNAVVDLRIWVDATMDVPAHFGGTADMRIGSFSPAYDDPFKPETPYMFGNGLVYVQGTLNANVVFVTDHGAKGELRLLPGGTVNLNGELIMDLCANCVLPDTPANIALLAQRSAKVSIIGSSGAFKVGLDPDPMVVDPTPPNRNLLANSPTAMFSFTADAGGVTPIVIVDNTVSSEISGTAFIAGAKLALNLDAYCTNAASCTAAMPLTLINAPPATATPVGNHLIGAFGTVTFLGSRTATVNYDYVNGDVFLNNFHIGAGAGTGSLVSSAVPEPSGLLTVMLALALLLCSFRAEVKRQTTRFRGYQCLKVRA